MSNWLRWLRRDLPHGKAVAWQRPDETWCVLTNARLSNGEQRAALREALRGEVKWPKREAVIAADAIADVVQESPVAVAVYAAAGVEIMRALPGVPP